MKPFRPRTHFLDALEPLIEFRSYEANCGFRIFCAKFQFQFDPHEITAPELVKSVGTICPKCLKRFFEPAPSGEIPETLYRVYGIREASSQEEEMEAA